MRAGRRARAGQGRQAGKGAAPPVGRAGGADDAGVEGLFEAHVAAGFDPDQFWRITPRVFLAQMRGARRALEREAERDVRLAWMVAGLTRAQKLPRLDQLVAPPPKLTPHEVLARMRAMTAHMPRRKWSDWCKQ